MLNILAIDIGNTSTHWGLFQESKPAPPQLQPTQQGRIPTHTLETIQHIHTQTQAHRVLIASVVPTATDRIHSLIPINSTLNWQCAGKLNIACKPPQCVGADRLANALGAQSMGHETALIIDMGTATTLNTLHHNTYHGGIIAPGIQAMTTDLNHTTALLPLLNTTTLPETAHIGTSTQQAMRIGITQGYPAMIQALVHSALQHLHTHNAPPPARLLTGGEASPWLLKALPDFTPIDTLTLQGLYYADTLHRSTQNP